MHIVITDHDVSISTHNRIELDARRATLFTSGGESYIISQNADGSLRIEAPGGELRMDIVSTVPQVAHVTAQGSCRACASRITRGLEGPCEGHKVSTRQGPRIIKSPKPRRVQCDSCDSTIEYTPEDLFCTQSLPCSDDVGPLAVKCPKLRCGGRGYPR
jgi:hypothetical protein